MRSLEFFEALLKLGSIEQVIINNPALKTSDVIKFFDEIFNCLKQNKEDTYELYTDGASKGNPGLSGVGYVIKKNSTVIDETCKSIGVATNNIAEYTALIEGLKKLLELKIKSINAYSDSELMVKQINGEYQVKNSKIKSLHAQVKNLIKQFDYFSISHIPREKNKLADKLSKEAAQ